MTVQKKTVPNSASDDSKVHKTFNIYSPVEGTVIPLSAVKDDAFSQEILGKTFAIMPKSTRIISPADGTIDNVARAKHAITIVTSKKVELLIHVGIDTVKLNGKYFDVVVKEGQKIKKGDLLMTFNKEGIEHEGYDSAVIIVISNFDSFASVIPTRSKNDLSEGATIFGIIG